MRYRQHVYRTTHRDSFKAPIFLITVFMKKKTKMTCSFVHGWYIKVTYRKRKNTLDYKFLIEIQQKGVGTYYTSELSFET